MKNKSYLLRIAKMLAAVLIGLVAAKTDAATINVDTTAQCGDQPCYSDDGVAGCSFGEAITAINFGSDVGDCKKGASDDYSINDTIVLPSGATLPFSLDNAQYENKGPTALPVFFRSVAIHGNGATLSRDPKSDFFRFFQIGSDFGSRSIFLTWDHTNFVGGNPGCESDCEGNCACYEGGAGLIVGEGIFAQFDQITFDKNATDISDHYYYNGIPRGGAVSVTDSNFAMVNFSKSFFKNNKAPFGGALYAGAGSQVGLSDCTFSGNSAESHLGPESQPMIPLSFNGSRLGGAVLTDGDSLLINGSSFFENVGRVGGAVAARNGLVNVSNSSFFSNHADLAGGSMAIPYNYRAYYDYQQVEILKENGFAKFAQDNISSFASKVSFSLQNVTVTQNTAGNTEGAGLIASGGGVANLGPGAFYLKNSVLAGNTVTEGGQGADCYGAYASLGGNDLIWPSNDGACSVIADAAAPTDLSEDPLLKPCVKDTTVPGQGSCDPNDTSPLVEKDSSCPDDDQHHVSRNRDACTVGAIEVKKPVPAVLTGTSCGNGQVEEGEQCDEGEARNSDEADATCRTDCTSRRCGDGIVDTRAGEECEPELDPINCRSDCTIDFCFQVKADAIRVGAGDLKLSDYLAKYAINPNTGCSPNPDVNQCQPLSSLGGPGSDHADFTVPNTVCLTTSGANGCSLTRESASETNAMPWALLALPVVLLISPFSRRLGLFSRT